MSHETTPAMVSEMVSEMTSEITPELAQEARKNSKSKLDLKDLFIMSLCPLMFGKLLIFYFGSNFSSNPGEGYGIGLSLAILFTLAMAGRFVWKYRDYQEE
ncbi:MAG: hypothetical protein AB7I41_15770 [Candidatus Sericytochromatia bacterium]